MTAFHGIRIADATGARHGDREVGGLPLHGAAEWQPAKWERWGHTGEVAAILVGMIEQVEAELREARLARDSEQVGALTMLLAALKDAEKANGGTLDDAGAIQVMTRERKKRVEAAESFREGGREDAALKEEAELALIDAYLPAQLAPEELSELIASAIAEAGATEPKDLGSVMKILQPKTAGRADGKAVSTAVREALGA